MVDRVVSPELHQLEQACNEKGSYPVEDGSDFELGDYSSLYGWRSEGLDESLRAPGSDDGRSGFRASKRAANAFLPAGLEFGPKVEGLSLEFNSNRRVGSLTVRFSGAAALDESSLEASEVWEELPPSANTVLLRQQLLDLTFGRGLRQGPLGRISRNGNDWVGLSWIEPPREGQFGRFWNRLTRGWVPAALWSDHDQKLVSFGWQPETGLNPSPLEGLPRRSDGGLVGMGRNLWSNGQDEFKFCWAAFLERGELSVDFTWSQRASQTAEEDVPSLGPELETPYRYKSNVIAGR